MKADRILSCYAASIFLRILLLRLETTVCMIQKEKVVDPSASCWLFHRGVAMADAWELCFLIFCKNCNGIEEEDSEYNEKRNFRVSSVYHLSQYRK